MNTIQFTEEIKAPKAIVWEALWEDENYREWTSEFSPGSYAESNWQEGDKIYFLTPEGEGMYSIIDKKVPHEYMSFTHIGMVKNGEELPLDEETKKWSGAKEVYTLKEQDGVTTVVVDLDIDQEHEEMMKGSFPKALKKLKELAKRLNENK